LVLVLLVSLWMRQQVVDHRHEVAARALGVRYDDAEDGSPNELLLHIAEEPLSPVVEENDAPLRIPPKDDAVRSLHEPSVDRLTRRELRSTPLLARQRAAEPPDLGPKLLSIRLLPHGKGL